MIWLGSAELGWAPEVLNLKTNLTELKKCLDDGVRNMVCSFGTVLCRARVGFDDPCESLLTYSLWFIDSVIVTVERKCQAWWNYCSCLATVMKLLTLITFFHAFMEARWSKHMFSYGYLGKGGLIYTSQFGLVYSIHSSPVSTVGKMVWVWQRMHEKRPRTNLINVRRWSRYTL